MSSLCSKCNERRNQNDLWDCDSCKRPLCGKCSELGGSEIKCMQLKKRVLIFLCEGCRNGLCQVPALRSEISKLQQCVEGLADSINKINTTSEVQLNQESVLNEAMLEEMNERMKRRSNLIIFGVQDRDSKESDLAIVNQVLNELDRPDNLNEFLFHRVGKFNVGKHRPIKITLHDEQQVKHLLRRSSHLKNNPNLPGKIFIAQDRTPRQIQYYKDIRKQFLERLDKGETNIRIKYFQNVPRIVSINAEPSRVTLN